MYNLILSSVTRSRQTGKEPQKATSETLPEETLPDVSSVPITTSRKSPQQERRDRRLTDADFEKELRERGATAIFEAALWPDGLVCPFCGSDRVERRENRNPMPYRCRACREYFSIASWTVMTGSKLPLETWARAIYIYCSPRHTTQPVLSTELADRLGVDEKTSSDLLIRLNLAAGSQFEPPLEESSELDVTELGGKLYRRKGRPRGKRRGRIKVIGVKGRDSGQLRFRQIIRYTKTAVRSFAGRFVGKWRRLDTDNHPSNRGIPDVEQHLANHSQAFVNRDDADACTNGIEGEWPLLNRALAFVSKGSLFALHLAGYQGRRNLRRIPHRDRIDVVISGMKWKHRCRGWLPPDEPPLGQLPLDFQPIQQVCGHCAAIARRRSKAQAKRDARQRKDQVNDVPRSGTPYRP